MCACLGISKSLMDTISSMHGARIRPFLKGGGIQGWLIAEMAMTGSQGIHGSA